MTAWEAQVLGALQGGAQATIDELPRDCSHGERESTIALYRAVTALLQRRYVEVVPGSSPHRLRSTEWGDYALGKALAGAYEG